MVWWLRSSPSSRETPITTSAKLSPPASRTRTDRTSATPGTSWAICPIRRSSPLGARSISASTLRAASRAAATSTSAATVSAATASARGYPADTSARPINTAVVPAKSDAKCHALARSAAFRSRVPVRNETDQRAASTINTPNSSTKAYHSGCTSPPPERSRITASKPIQIATAARIAASDSAARC